MEAFPACGRQRSYRSASAENYQATGNLTGHSFNGIIKLSSKLTDKDTLSATWFVAQGTQTAPTSSELTPYFENAPIHVETTRSSMTAWSPVRSPTSFLLA